MSADFSNIIEKLQSKETEIRTNLLKKPQLSKTNNNQVNSFLTQIDTTLRKNFEEYTNLLDKLKIKLGEPGLDVTEIARRKQALKDMTDTYTALKKQLDTNNIKLTTFNTITEGDFSQPLNREEYYKLKEEKVKSKIYSNNRG
jgi:hypothetical protein